MHFLDFPAYQKCVVRNQTERLKQRLCFEHSEKMTYFLLNKMQPLVFEGSGFVFHEKLDHFHILALPIPNVFDARTSSRNNDIRQRSTDGQLVIETLIEKMEKDVLKNIESVSLDDSYSFFDKMGVAGFYSKDSNSKWYRRLSFLQLKIVAN